MFEPMGRVVISDGAAQAKALEEASEKMKMRDSKSSAQKAHLKLTRKILDFLTLYCVQHSASMTLMTAVGAKILDPEKHPLIHSWVSTLKEMPVVKDITPPHDKLVELLLTLRRNYTKASN